MPCAALVWSCTGVSACTVPVSRYALERWGADNYELVVFFRDKLDDATRDTLDKVRKSHANVWIVNVDVASGIPDAYQALLSTNKLSVLPQLALLYPEGPRAAYELEPVWVGPATPDELLAMIDSPARREAAGRILSGELVVWIFVESGNRKSDVAAKESLDRELTRLKGELKLNEEIEIEGAKIGSSIPLKIDFSIVTISRNDPREKFFRAMLFGIKAGLNKKGDVPAAFPLFGQGRLLDSLVGSEISAASVGEVCSFLTQDCSCLVKEQDPGIDMLMNVNWEAALEEGRIVDDTGLPSLAIAAPPAQIASPPPLDDVPGSARSVNPVLRNLVMAAVGLLIIALTVSVVIGYIRQRR